MLLSPELFTIRHGCVETVIEIENLVSQPCFFRNSVEIETASNKQKEKGRTFSEV